MTECKTCARCRELKPPTSFPKDHRRRDGLFPYCRECKQASDRASHARHKERRNAAERARYVANPEPYKTRSLVYYYANPDYVKQNVTNWAAANAERRTEIRRASATRRYAVDPEPKREAWRRRHAAIRRGCAVYPFTPAQLVAKVAYWGERCWICSGPYDAIDHVKPLAKQGPHMLANLRPICTPCNTRKRDRWPFLAA
ncbi:MAG TPA: HNH endonuclease signature motif containing protein [Pseudonocardia sp.]